MIKLLVPLALMIFGWIVVTILARRTEKKVQSEWETLLSPASERTFLQTRNQVERSSSMLGVAINEAIETRKLGDLDEAIRFLDTSGDVIERFTPNLLSLLKVMIKFSRMMSAITPVSPILPHDFHLGELTNLAHLNRMLHHFLISARQRFRLKLYLLGKGVAIASRYLLQGIKNVVTRRSAADQEWEEIAKIGQDFQRLSNESVQSLRALLEALSTDAAKELAKALCSPEKSQVRMQSATSRRLLAPSTPAPAAFVAQEVEGHTPSSHTFGTVWS
jgi:hypothetical protein